MLSDGRAANHLHHALLALLVTIRPLIWDGAPGEPAALGWYILVAAGLVLLGLELLAGTRRTWSWSPLGLFTLLAVALLIPAGLRTPQAFVGLADLGYLLGHLAFGLYLTQTIAGRERTVLAALLAGLGVETLYALGQQVWVLPALEEQLRSSQGATGLGSELIERIQNGGVYGTFTLSNTLAGYLVLVLPLALGLVASRTRVAVRVAALVIAGAGSTALLCTNSKGAWAAAILAIAVVGWRRASGWWRVALPATVAVGLVVVLSVPGLRQRLAASADVRLGYWQAAATLIGERPWSGHGLGGFATEASRVLAVGAEYSRYTHNEVLDAAVAGGVLAGTALAALFAILLLRRARPPTSSADVAPAWLPLVVVAGLIYLHIFGLLPAGGFPFGEHDLNLLFILPFAALAGGIMALMRRVDPSAWAIELGVVAVVLHSLLDFDLHAGGVLGSLMAVTCLSSGARTQAVPRAAALGPLVLALALVAGLGFASPRSAALREAQAFTEAVRALDSARGNSAALESAARTLHWRLGQHEPTAADLAPSTLARVRQQACERAWQAALAAPAPADLAGAVLTLSPPSRERLPRSSMLAVSFPHSAMVHGLLAEDLAAAGQWHEALAAARAAVRLSPWRLAHRLRLATLLERCAAAKGDPALLAEAQSERQRIAELQPQVHFRDRLPNDRR